MKQNSYSKEELISLVRSICVADFETEEEYEAALKDFVSCVPHPEAADLIFHHDPELTPEEIVEKALSYKPIILLPPGNKGKD